MKNLLKGAKAALFTICLTILFLSIPQLAQAQAEGVTFLDEIRNFLNTYFITEASFLALTVMITEFISRVTGITEKSIVMGVSLAVTLVMSLVGFFLKVGIFAEISIFNLIVFVIMKTFGGNGLYDWIRLLFSAKGKSATA